MSSLQQIIPITTLVAPIAPALLVFFLTYSPSINKRRILKGLENVSKNYKNFMEMERDFRVYVVSLFFILFFFLSVSYLSNKTLNSAFYDFLVFASITAAINIVAIILLKISYRYFEGEDFLSLLSTLYDLSKRKSKGETFPKGKDPSDWLTFFRKHRSILSVSVTLFRYQFLLWGFSVLYLTALFYEIDISSNTLILFETLSLSSILTLVTILLSISAIILALIFHKSLDRYGEISFEIYNMTHPDNLTQEDYTFHTISGQYGGKIYGIGKQLILINNASLSDNGVNIPRSSLISIPWKNIYSVQCVIEIDNSQFTNFETKKDIAKTLFGK